MKDNKTVAEQASAQFRSIADKLSDGIAGLDASGCVIWANASAREMLGDETCAPGVKFLPEVKAGMSVEISAPSAPGNWLKISSAAGADHIGFASVLTITRSTADHEARDEYQHSALKSELSRVFSTINNEDSAHSAALETLLEYTRSKFGLIGYIDENGDMLATSISDDVWNKCNFNTGKTIIHKAALPGIIKRVISSGVPEVLAGKIVVPEGHVDLDNAMAAPVKSLDSVVGIIIVSNKNEPYSESDLDALSVAAQYIGPMLSLMHGRSKQENKLRKYEEELKQTEIINRLLLDSLPHPAMLVNKDRVIVAANRFAHESGAIVSTPCWHSFHNDQYIPDDKKPPEGINACNEDGVMCHFCLADQALDANEPIRIEVEKSGSIWDTWWVPVNENLFLHYAVNVTEHKQNERQLELYRDRLEELVRQRTMQLEKAMDMLVSNERLAALGQFAGGMAHEIRNPLGVIGTSVYILKRRIGAEDTRAIYHIDRIKEQVDNCANIIESILRLTRMEAPKLEPVNAAQHLRSVINALRVPPSISIDADINDDQLTVIADREQIRIAFKNILTNSIQAMPDGGEIRVTLSPPPDGRTGMAVFTFKDNGPGISKTNIDKVFQPLYTTKATGIGFGLSIVKQIIDKHNGTIKVESVMGEGAAFTVTLPVA